MPTKRDLRLTAPALLLIAAALLALAGCNRAPRTQTFADKLPSAEQTASTAASDAAGTTGGGNGTAGAGAGSSSSGGSGSGGSSSSKLSTKDASALDAELEAIQSELDRLSVPSDSDFDSIGSGLQ